MIWCCGAGTSADTEAVTGLISSQLELHRLATNTEPRVVTALTRLKQHLFKYQGHVSAALVLGGNDPTGSYLYTVYPHGSTDKLPYATMGSGSLAAMAIFEAKYRDDLDVRHTSHTVQRCCRSFGANCLLVVLCDGVNRRNLPLIWWMKPFRPVFSTIWDRVVTSISAFCHVLRVCTIISPPHHLITPPPVDGFL